MPRKQPKSLSKRDRDELLDELWSMVILLNTKEEVENFFKDLLSETEAIMLARRIRIARFLLEGKRYDDITELMSAGPATIASVHRWLQGSNKGYVKAIPKLKTELEKKGKKEDREEQARDPFSLERLKRKYPLHFLLLNLIDLKDKETTRRERN